MTLKPLMARIGSTTIEVPLIKGGFRGIVNVGGGRAASLRCRRAHRVYGNPKQHRHNYIHKQKKASPTKGEVWRGGRTPSLSRAHNLTQSQELPQRITKKADTSLYRLKEAATYSPTTKCSTIGVSELNFSVRNGKRWDLAAITTLILSTLFSSSISCPSTLRNEKKFLLESLSGN